MIVVAGTHSGVGKTTVALALMAGLRERGVAVQPFKVGPDFIDPQHHQRAAGRPSSNLDGWLLGRDVSLAIAGRRCRGADAAVVEGMMGLFDGHDGRSESGSTAEMAKWLGAPVLLVLDASALSRSAAALVHGFSTFDPELHVAGVVLNRVAGERHERWLREAIEPTGVSVLGAIAADDRLAVPERHLGLALDAVIPAAAGLDLDAILAAAGPLPAAPDEPPPAPRRARIAVLRDEALSFHYADSLAELERAGAELVDVSPLRDELPEAVGAVLAGGGYPELHAEALAANRPLLDGLRALAAAGRPVYGECGGMMLLGRDLIDADGRAHAMAGVLPLVTRMTSRPTLAYAEIEVTDPTVPFPLGERIRAHTFHFAAVDGEPSAATAYVVRADGLPDTREGWREGSALGSWLHLHLAANPRFAAAFVDAAARVDPLGSPPFS